MAGMCSTNWCPCCGSQCIAVWPGYEDPNDAVRLARDPATQAVVGRRALESRRPALKPLCETEVLVTEKILRGLEQLNAEWVKMAMEHIKH